MHYASSISRRTFETVIEHDTAAGFAVREVAGRELPPVARRGLQALAHGRLTVLQASGHTATLRCERPPRDVVDTYAVLDSVVAGERWFLSSRLVWRQHDFADVDAARVHDRIVIAGECGDAEDGDDAGLYRLTYDDVEGAAIRKAVRDLLLRELVLRPAFEDHLRSERSVVRVPRSGDDGSAHG